MNSFTAALPQCFVSNTPQEHLTNAKRSALVAWQRYIRLGATFFSIPAAAYDEYLESLEDEEYNDLVKLVYKAFDYQIDAIGFTSLGEVPPVPQFTVPIDKCFSPLSCALSRIDAALADGRHDIAQGCLVEVILVSASLNALLNEVEGLVNMLKWYGRKMSEDGRLKEEVMHTRSRRHTTLVWITTIYAFVETEAGTMFATSDEGAERTRPEDVQQ